MTVVRSVEQTVSPPEESGLWMWVTLTTVVVVSVFALGLVLILGINTP